jgi:tetratricopeptide (TPR) repeat protein
MSKKKKPETQAGFEGVENALTRAEQYIEENQKSLSIIVLAIIVIVGGYLGYNKFYLEPANNDAHAAMYVAEQYFETDSFRLALNGDGQNFGMLDIIDEYSVTPAANLAHYYAGISYLQLGEFENAIDHLKKFDSEDIMVASVALGAIGDSYAELGNDNKALEYYIKAGERRKNEFTTPIYLKKAAIIYEGSQKYGKALQLYESIKNEFPETEIGREMDKYIASVKVKIDQN